VAGELKSATSAGFLIFEQPEPHVEPRPDRAWQLLLSRHGDGHYVCLARHACHGISQFPDFTHRFSSPLIGIGKALDLAAGGGYSKCWLVRNGG